MTATSNHKLTELLKGRTVSGSSDGNGEKSISFSDGSKLTVKTAPSNSNSASTGGTVEKVRQSVEPPVLHLDTEGGSTVEIPLAEATSSVMLRSKDDNLEYAD